MSNAVRMKKYRERVKQDKVKKAVSAIPCGIKNVKHEVTVFSETTHFLFRIIC